MGIALLKKLNTKLPDFIKIAAGSIIRKKLIENPVFQKQIKELREMEIKTYDEIKIKQMQKLKQTLIHAYEHTEYYKEVFDSVGFNPYGFRDFQEMERIPVLTKKILIDKFEKLQADDIDDYYLATTGGSTGVPVKVFLERDSIYKEKAFIYHFWEKYGYDYKSSKIATFRGVEFGKKIYKVNPIYNEIQLNPCNINVSTVYQYYKKIMSYRAEFLHGYPSAIYTFCRFASQVGLDLKRKFKAVFFISENVYEYQEKYIREILGCPTAAFYGHSERAVFAEQNLNQEKQEYIFNDLYSYWEIEASGQIITTGFLNSRMPLIRYELDDIAKGEENLYKIEGHWKGIVFGKNGEVISAATLNVHAEILDKIAKIQYVQREKGKLEILLVPLVSWSKDDEDNVRKLYQNKLKQTVEVEIKAVDDVIYTKRGKFQLLIQEIN